MQTEEADSSSGGGPKLPENHNRLRPRSRVNRRMRRSVVRIAPFLCALLIALSGGLIPLPLSATDCQVPAGGGLPDCGAPSTWVCCVAIKGFVYDSRQNPIPGATVYGGEQPVTSGEDGYYTTRVKVQTNQTHVTLWATKPGYETQYLNISLNDASSLQNFFLPYVLTPSVSPKYFNNSPPKTLTFTAETSSPLEGTAVWIELPGGGVLDLAFQSVSESGSTLWQGSYTPPEGTIDGSYTWRACAVDIASSGKCTSLTSGLLLSKVVSGTYIIDSVLPTISSPLPVPDHNLLERRPIISVLVSDTLSGIDFSSITLSVDGTTVVHSYDLSTGLIRFTSSSDLVLGLHLVTATARDRAGNTSELSWELNVTTLTATNAIGRLQEQTVQVNPTADVLNPPSTVTFANVTVNLGPYDLILGPSPYTGLGSFERTVDLYGAQVIFNNETGVPSTVSPGLSSRKFSTKASLLFPESQATTARIPASALDIGSIMVSIPAGYNTPGSTATIRMDAVAASAVAPAATSNGNKDPLPNEFNLSADPPLLTVASQRRYLVDKHGADLSISTVQGSVEAYVWVGGENMWIS